MITTDDSYLWSPLACSSVDSKLNHRFELEKKNFFFKLFIFVLTRNRFASGLWGTMWNLKSQQPAGNVIVKNEQPKKLRKFNVQLSRRHIYIRATRMRQMVGMRVF